MRRWQIQEAKDDLSALVRAAEHEGPQTITRHGEPVAVLVSAGEYQALRAREAAQRESLFDFLSSWPAFDVPARDRNDRGRDVQL